MEVAIRGALLAPPDWTGEGVSWPLVLLDWGRGGLGGCPAGATARPAEDDDGPAREKNPGGAGIPAWRNLLRSFLSLSFCLRLSLNSSCVGGEVGLASLGGVVEELAPPPSLLRLRISLASLESDSESDSSDSGVSRAVGAREGFNSSTTSISAESAEASSGSFWSSVAGTDAPHSGPTFRITPVLGRPYPPLASLTELRIATRGSVGFAQEVEYYILRRSSMEWKLNQFPWQVSLQARREDGSYSHFCGGSLLTDKHVLTAAHCMVFEADEFRVVAGILNLSQSDTVGEIRSVAGIVVNNGYNPTTLVNDAAVVTLESPVDLSNPAIDTIKIGKEEPNADTRCDNSGWGLTSPNNDYLPDHLMWVALDYMTDSDCLVWWPTILNGDAHICFKDKSDGVGSPCNGDSGGPIVCPDPEMEGAVRQFGVVSFGNQGCSETNLLKYPAVFAQVSNYQLRCFVHINCEQCLDDINC
ncbi:unnamed protein product [Cyprideis torosa]|uniref:Uncharacterized protein n=1 Tax=Cyprideis torosa TaxID=163714 RepID=A0A7R8ZQJ0_9CRUS|nr:unnamed protein product [Cyprideis torosa]CAG0901494.1 unnamed protein product [Cyprideis torosa]